MRLFFVSAFTEDVYRGNPAALCLLDNERNDAYLQAIARELDRPVTVYLKTDGDAWLIRWFTPEMELDICGHGTLAAAFLIMNQQLKSEKSDVKFRSKSAEFRASLAEEGRVRLDFPAWFGKAAEPPLGLIEAVGSPPISISCHGDRWIFEYGSAQTVRNLKPNFRQIEESGIGALIATAISDQSEFDIISRNFAPSVGLNEDHVTGTAHTCLATYWHQTLGSKLRCWQASPRGGSVITELVGERVYLEGSAVMQAMGEWCG